MTVKRTLAKPEASVQGSKSAALDKRPLRCRCLLHPLRGRNEHELRLAEHKSSRADAEFSQPQNAKKNCTSLLQVLLLGRRYGHNNNLLVIVRSGFSLRKCNMSSHEVTQSSVVPFRRLWTVGCSGFLLLLCLDCLGCGSSDPLNRKAVLGKVTVDGVAVPNGSISFEPLSAGGVGSGAVISTGKYSISKADGLPSGKYLVRITGDDGANFAVSPGKMPGDEIMPPKKELVPASWNSNSKEEIEVKQDGPTTFDFAIDTKKR